MSSNWRPICAHAVQPHAATFFEQAEAAASADRPQFVKDESQLTKSRWLRSCAYDPKKASAKVGRCFRRLHAHGIIAKIAAHAPLARARPTATRRWTRRCICASTTSPRSTPQQQWPDLLRQRQKTHSNRIYPPFWSRC